MRHLSRVAAALNVRPGEGGLVALLFLHSFGMGSTIVFAYTTASALFLSEFGAHDLPYIYLGAAATVPLVGLVFARLERVIPLTRLLALTLTLLFASACLARLILGLADAGWVVFVLPIWVDLVYALTGLGFWALAGRLFDVGQAKRLFSLVGSGEIIARIAGYLSVPLLVLRLGTANLLLIAAAGLLLSLAVLFMIVRRHEGDIGRQPGQSEQQKQAAVMRSAFGERYPVLILLATLLATVVYYGVDFAFFAELELHYSDPDSLARFLGLFFGTQFLVTVVWSTLVSPRLINRYGLRPGLLARPVGVLLSLSAATITTVLGGPAQIRFWLAAATKFTDDMLNSALYRPVTQLLYQPLRSERRTLVRTAALMIVEPLAAGIAGGVLLLLGALALGTGILAYGIGALICGWIAVVILAHRAYAVALKEALSQRFLEGRSLSLDDASSVAVLERVLQSRHPAEVRYALDLLEQVRPASLPGLLAKALAHADPHIRSDALGRIARLKLTALLPVVRQRLQEDQMEDVRAAAVRALCAIAGSAALAEARLYLADVDARMRAAAIAGLLANGAVSGEPVVTAGLNRMVDATDTAERRLAARMLGEAAVAGYEAALQRLLRDGEMLVRRDAVWAAGRVKDARLWPLVLQNISVPMLRAAVIEALVEGGAAALPAIREAFVAPGQDRSLRMQLARVCSRVGGEPSREFLRDQIAVTDPDVRTEVLRALSRCNFVARGEEIAPLRRQIRLEIAGAAAALATREDLGMDGRCVTVRAALATELRRQIERTLYLASFLHDRQAVLRALRNLAHTSHEQRAFALEILDVVLPHDLKAILFPLLNSMPEAEQLRRLEASFPQVRLGRTKRLAALISGADAHATGWVRACALHAAGVLMACELAESVGAARQDADPRVREAAVWAWAWLHGCKPDEREQVSDAGSRQTGAAHADGDGMLKEGGAMLTIVEKVLILKTVSLFADTPEDILAELALLLDEMTIRAGTTLFRKGESGTSMYIIVEGNVRVHDDEFTLNHLQARDAFGEMALLDPEPRVASVTAVEETRLLRLDQEPFFELMDTHTEVARGVIRVLSRHLRARLRDLHDLRQGIAAPTSQ